MKTLPAPTPDADEVEFNSLGAEAQLIAYMKSVRQWDVVTAPNNLRHEDIAYMKSIRQWERATAPTTAPNNLRHEDRPLYILDFLWWDEEPQQWPTSVDLRVAALLLMPIPRQILGRTAEQDAPYHAHQKLIMKLLSELLPEAFRDQPIPIAEIVRIATRKESQQWLSPQSPFHLLDLERLWGQGGRKKRGAKKTRGEKNEGRKKRGAKKDPKALPNCTEQLKNDAEEVIRAMETSQKITKKMIAGALLKLEAWKGYSAEVIYKEICAKFKLSSQDNKCPPKISYK